MRPTALDAEPNGRRSARLVRVQARVDRRLTQAPRLAVRVLSFVSLVAMTALPAACIHDWDSLDPAKGDASDVCTFYCDTYLRCIKPDADCLSTCEADVADCPTQSRLDLKQCVAELDDQCGGVASEGNFDLCKGFIQCVTQS